jgi:acyl-CoA reductase-like NAD-dependent aldehyde dehydrogenase
MMIKRLYVHESIYETFRDALVKATAALKSGEGHEPGVFFGPLQNSMQYEKVKELINDVVVNEGVTTALGGKVEASDATSNGGYFVTPTIIDNPPDTSRIVTEEPFGPVVPILKWSDEADVIHRANDTKMGLGASVWSKDLVRAERMARQLEAGSVWVNNHFQVAPNVPFGGHKWSGLGMEWGTQGLEIYCNPQSVWVFKA